MGSKYHKKGGESVNGIQVGGIVLNSDETSIQELSEIVKELLKDEAIKTYFEIVVLKEAQKKGVDYV